MMSAMDLKDWVRAERGRAVRLGAAIGVHPVLIRQWSGQERPIPVRHMAAIELATGGAVTREEMCEDWARVWPELARASGAKAVEQVG